MDMYPLHFCNCYRRKLRGLKAWIQYFYHVFWPDPFLLLDMKTEVKVQRIYFICQPHPSTCSLTTPRPHPLPLYRKGRVLPSFPKHPRKFKAEVLAMVLSYLNGMYVFYLMYSNIPSGGFLIRPS